VLPAKKSGRLKSSGGKVPGALLRRQSSEVRARKMRSHGNETSSLD
jgi:hypothetical protein